MEDGNVYTVNVLPIESVEAVRIVGSTCLQCMDLMQEMDYFCDDKLALRLKEEAQYKRIITYCGGGIAARVNAMAHVMTGQENVAVYDDFMSEWEEKGCPQSGRESGRYWGENCKRASFL